MMGENGSFAHNLDTPFSDHDYIGIIVPPMEHVIIPFSVNAIGISKPFEHWRFSDAETNSEGTFYSLGKFFQLLLSGNPNVIGLLWNRREFIWGEDNFLLELLSEKHRFSSQRSISAFFNFAKNEIDTMKKMTGQTGEKRRNLILEHGYNAKSAVNAVRMMRMCVEFNATGILNVFRDDRESLMEIKQGKASESQIVAEVSRLSEQIQTTRSVLRPFPDSLYAMQVVMDTYRDRWGY